jgi:hypothetical protein
MASGNPPGELKQAFIKGLYNTGFTLLGEGVGEKLRSPAAGQAIGEMGQDIVNTIQMDWWKQQAENFKARYGDAYEEGLKMSQSEYETAITPVPIPAEADPEYQQAVAKGDATASPNSGFMINTPGGPNYIPLHTPEARAHYQKATNNFYTNMRQLTNSYLDATSQYPNNPLIGQKGQQVMQQFMGFMGDHEASLDQANQFQTQQMEGLREKRAQRGEQRAEGKYAREEGLAESRDQGILDWAEANKPGLMPNTEDPQERLAAARAIRARHNLEIGDEKAQAEIAASRARHSGERLKDIPEDVSPDALDVFVTQNPEGSGFDNALLVAEEEQRAEALKRGKQLFNGEEGRPQWSDMSIEDREAFIAETLAQNTRGARQSALLRTIRNLLRGDKEAQARYGIGRGRQYQDVDNFLRARYGSSAPPEPKKKPKKSTPSPKGRIATHRTGGLMSSTEAAAKTISRRREERRKSKERAAKQGIVEKKETTVLAAAKTRKRIRTLETEIIKELQLIQRRLASPRTSARTKEALRKRLQEYRQKYPKLVKRVGL